MRILLNQIRLRRGTALRVDVFFMAVLFMLAHVRTAEAIPAFARNLNLPCTMCHVGFPKLNQFGKEFLDRGFRLAGQEGKFMWEQPLPIAGRLTQDLRVSRSKWSPELPADGLTNNRTTALELISWQLLTGGTLAPHVSFFGQLVGTVPGLGPGGTGTSGTVHSHAEVLQSNIRSEVFWIQINDLLPESRMNLKIGQDHIDNHFLSTPMRLTYADYLIQFQPMMGASLHSTSVGAILVGELPDGLNYDVGVRNYSPTFVSKIDNQSRLGAVFALFGKQIGEDEVSVIVNTDKTGDAGLGQERDVLGYGMSMDIHLGRFNLIPGLFWYHEGSYSTGPAAPVPADGGDHEHAAAPGVTAAADDSSGGSTGNRLNVFSGTVEAIFALRPALLATLRYDFNDWSSTGQVTDPRARQYVAGLAWYQYPNMRWVFEYSRLTTKNMMIMGDPGALMPMVTSADTKQTADRVMLLLDLDF